MTAHAKLSASSAKKWLNCTGSIAMEKKMPNESSEFAKEGTTAHKLGELKIKRAIGSISQKEYNKEVVLLQTDAEMERYMEQYKDFVLGKYRKGLIYENDALLELEQRVDYSAYAPEGFGTADVLLVFDRHIEIIDLKYGRGVEVSADHNPQLMLYGLGALTEYHYLYDIASVSMTIFQPRMGNISTFEMTAQELYDWGKSIKETAQIAYSEQGGCFPGKHCTEGFCRATPICRAFSDYMKNTENDKLLTTLSNDEIAEILDKAEMLAKWAKRVKEYALQNALQGVEYKGFKLVEGRKSRQFSIPDNEVAALLQQAGYSEDKIYKKALRTVADFEKVLPECFSTLLGQYVEVKAGAPTLVSVEDKRPAYHSAENDFKDIKV